MAPATGVAALAMGTLWVKPFEPEAMSPVTPMGSDEAQARPSR